MPRDPAQYHITSWPGPAVRFWRRSQCTVQAAKLTSRNGFFVHYSKSLRCFTMFAAFLDARGGELERNVSLANLVCHNVGVFGLSPAHFPWEWHTAHMDHLTAAFWRRALEESYRHGLEWHHALVPLVLASRRALGTDLSLPVDVIRHVRSYLCEYMM